MISRLRHCSTCAFFAILVVRSFAADAPAAATEKPFPTLRSEPTNATEAAAQKAATDGVTAEKFQAWKKTLSPEHQAWEAVLEANLGSYYLPLYRQDKVKGVPTGWDFVADQPGLPRVLLIGDSISRGYTLPVRARLAGRANVHRAPENCGPTANGLKKLAVWLGAGKWDVIHFNFGIHDRATPEADYAAQLAELHARLRATGATLIWASSTPLPAESRYGADAAIVRRNEIAARVMAVHGTRVDDLYTYISPRLADYQKRNDVHFSDAGYDFLGEHVAREIARALPAK